MDVVSNAVVCALLVQQQHRLLQGHPLAFQLVVANGELVGFRILGGVVMLFGYSCTVEVV